MPLVETDRWRSFIAVELPKEVRNQLEGPLAALNGVDDVVRRNPTDRIHLTLVFLGDVDAGRIVEVGRVVRQSIGTAHRFSLEVRGVGAFPSMRRPRILWAGIEDSGRSRLLELQANLTRGLAAVGFPSEEREFRPHLTLGRLRREANRDQRTALSRWQADWMPVSLGTIEVTHVNLMRSELPAGSPRHTTLETFALK